MMLSQLPGPGPYSVICPGTVGGDEPSTFSALRDALCWAQNTADAYDVQCLVTDRLGNSMELRRGSGRCAFPRDPALSPLAPEPYFHPNPEHPRSRRRFLRNEPESFVPGGGDPRPTAARPRDFFGGTLPLMASLSVVVQWQQELMMLMQAIQRLPEGTMVCDRSRPGSDCLPRERALIELGRVLGNVGSGDEYNDPSLDTDESLTSQILDMRRLRQQITGEPGLTKVLLACAALGVGAFLLTRW